MKTVRESQRHSRDSGVALGELGIDRPCNLNVHVSFFEIAAANIGLVGDGPTNTQRRAAPRLNTISARDELYFARAEHVVDMEAELRALFAPFWDSQFLGWRSQHRKLGGCIGAQFPLCIGAGPFDIVSDGHAGLEFVAGSG